MSKCVHTGCPGKYGSHGYCDECGRKAPPAGQQRTGPPPPQSSAPAQPTTPSAQRTAPFAQPPAPSAHTTAPFAQPPTPSAQPVAPSAQGTAPSAQRSTPSVAGTLPATGRPASATTRPSRRTTAQGTISRVRRPPRGTIGGGWVDLPPVSPRDSATTSVVLEVPESKRFCVCGQPVGRGKDGKPGLTKGFCPKCGTQYMFTPQLAKGELVGREQRYEIIKCIARGGQGWIYLARDRNLGDNVVEHQVVLKGLIDTDDESAVRQAINERHYLLEVKHQNIVKINDFVQHPDPRTGRLAGYIVMEYINGWSLQELYRQHHDANGQRAPLPLPHVLAYGLDVLLALGHLHGKGLLYCDFKPENALYTGTEFKLIDLGAVVRASDPGQEVLFTPGFDAPELDKLGPSVASDLYTVGRTLAVLSLTFARFSTDYRYQLPDPATTPLLAEQESFHRLLRRATHPDRNQRFGSAEEMHGQLEGVLLEVLSTADEIPRSTVSTQFTVEQRTFGTDADTVTAPPTVSISGKDNSISRNSISGKDTVSDEDEAGEKVDWAEIPHALPAPLVDPHDPGAVHLAAIAATDPNDMIEALLSIPVQSPEVQLQLVGVQIAAGDLDAAGLRLDGYATTAPPGDWRTAWYRGITELTAGRPAQAKPHFEAVYDALPGELPPKLALAAAAEWDGHDERAGTLYKRVWHTDDRYVSAAFGLARVLRRRGDLAGAVAALDGVPDTSSQHVLAQVAAIRAKLTARLTTRLAKDDLLDAAARLERLRMGIERQAHISIKVLAAALDWVSGNGDSGSDLSGTILGRALNERQLRFGLEKAYRDLATVTEDSDRRIALVKQANRIRPRTLF